MKKRQKQKALIVIILAAALILIVLITGPKSSISNDECSRDSECVPATCCHQTECLQASKAPKCENITCTQECAPDSMDCLQGECRCINNKCSAIIK